MYHCIAPNKDCGNHICCGLPPTPNSYWCQKHIKYFGGITSKYHELESKLKLDPFEYPRTTEYLKWSKREIEIEFKLLWKIYALRLKLREYGFADGFRDPGHDYRLQAINNSLYILNSKLSVVDCEQYEIQEQDELVVVEKSNKIRLDKKKRTTKIQKQQEIVGVWNLVDVIIYCKRQAASYLLACLRKYFQRWPDGDALFEHSINMASEMCAYCEDWKRPSFEHINTARYNTEHIDRYHHCCIDCTVSRIVLNPHNHIAPIVALIKSYNININDLLGMVPRPSWLMWELNTQEEANYAIKYYIEEVHERYLTNGHESNSRVLKFINDSSHKQLPMIDIKSAIHCVRLNKPMRYKVYQQDNKIVYRRFINNDVELYGDDDIIKSLSQIEVDITKVGCGCAFVATMRVNTTKLKETIGNYISETAMRGFEYFTLMFTQFHYPQSLYLFFDEFTKKEDEIGFETSMKEYYNQKHNN